MDKEIGKRFAIYSFYAENDGTIGVEKRIKGKNARYFTLMAFLEEELPSFVDTHIFSKKKVLGVIESLNGLEQGEDRPMDYHLGYEVARQDIKKELFGECGCVCHGTEFVNDCHYLEKDVCVSCGKKSATHPDRDAQKA